MTTIRAITEDELERFRWETLRAFGADPTDDPEVAQGFRELMPLERTYAAFDGDMMIGTSAAFSFELSVPGGMVPMAGLTAVTVRPTHRRRGVLRAMIAAHFRDVSERGEALSGLWSSEAPIYRRFGYGVAAEGDDLSFDATGLDIDYPGPFDRVELAEEDRELERVEELFDRVRARRPATFSRSPAWWRYRQRYDPPQRRGGASARRVAVAWRGGDPTGWVTYRQQQKWDEALPAGRLEIIELVAIDAAAEATLWSYVSSIDLFPDVHWWNAPTDAALPWLTVHHRRLRRLRRDSLWLRPCDVVSALAARSYAQDGRLCFELRDGTETSELYQLDVEAGVGRCQRIDKAPELQLDRSALGSIYLGGIRPSVLARAGRIRGEQGALARADGLFGWPVAPWCPEIF